MRKMKVSFMLCLLFITCQKNFNDEKFNLSRPHLIFTCSKSTIETIEKGVKYVNNKNTRTDAIDFEQIIVNWVSLSYVLMLYNGNL